MKFLLLFLTMLVSLQARSQERREHISKQIDFTGKAPGVFYLDNINGYVHVEGYDGTKVILEADKWIKASSTSDLDKYWNKLQLVVHEEGDSAEAYVDGLCDCDCNEWGHHYGNHCDFDGDFSFNITLKVPEHMNLVVSTVNNGDITIDHVYGSLKVRNVNGGITMNDVSGTSDVKTINGDITIRYSRNPAGDSRYYTLNGKLTVYYQPQLSADLRFKTFQGNFYTNFDYKTLPAARLVSVASGKKGMFYQIDDRTGIRIGDGDVKLDFETFNGNVYIRKMTSE